MPNPEPFLAHLRAEGYHPRSDKHSNALARCIVRDLVEHCPLIREKAGAGELVYSLNFQLLTGTAEGVIVVSLDTAEPASATFVALPPAPPVGDPMHYDAFIQTLCSRYTECYR